MTTTLLIYGAAGYTGKLIITAELKVYALAEAWSQRAATAGVMLLPGASGLR